MHFRSFTAGAAGMAVVALGSFTAGARLHPQEIKHDDEFELHSFDDSSHVPRTWAYCFGEDAIYMSGDADGITSVGNSLNCDEGGVLRG